MAGSLGFASLALLMLNCSARDGHMKTNEERLRSVLRNAGQRKRGSDDLHHLLAHHSEGGRLVCGVCTVKPSYRYNADVLRVLDGDTIEVSLDFGFYIRQRVILRMADIDTMELNATDAKKRARAESAKKYVEDMIGGKQVVCETIKPKDKFGRYLSRVHFDGRCVNDTLVELKLAERM